MIASYKSTNAFDQIHESALICYLGSKTQMLELLDSCCAKCTSSQHAVHMQYRVKHSCNIILFKFKVAYACGILSLDVYYS